MSIPPPDAAVARLMNTEAEPGVIDVSVGEPDQPVPAVLVERAIDSLRSGETGYTPKLGLWSLRQLIAQSLPFSADPHDVVITVGGTEAVAVALAASCHSGDTVLVPDPAWPNYRVLATQLGIQVRTYRQGADSDDFFDWDEITAGLSDGARLVVVNSPSNPMAALATAADLQRLVNLANEHGAMVLADEAYEAITFDADPAPSAAAAEGARDTVFVARTFSKTYSMTGLRVGVLIAPPSLRADVAAIHGTVVGCAPRTAQLVAGLALTELPQRGQELSAIYRDRFQLALQRLGQWMPQSQVAGHGGFYVWLDGRHTGLTAEQLTAEMAARGVRVSSGNAYSTTESAAIRLALTVSGSELETVLAAAEEVLGQARS